MKKALVLSFLIAALVSSAQTTKPVKRLNFIGVEAGITPIYYRTVPLDYYTRTVDISQFGGLFPGSEAYFNNPLYQPYGGNYQAVVSATNWEQTGVALNASAMFALGNKKLNTVNKHHRLTLGISYGNRQLIQGDYYKIDNRELDSIGSVNVSGTDYSIIKDSSTYSFLSAHAEVKHYQFQANYMYIVNPEEKINISFGGGIDAGLAHTSLFFGYNALTQSEVTTYVGTPDNNGYLDKSRYTHSQSSYGNNPKQFGFIVRPSAAMRIDYKLSKNIAILRNINLFGEGRFGYELTKVGNSKLFANPLLAYRIGIAVTLNKYAKL